MRPVLAEAQHHSQPSLLGRRRDHFNPTIVISDVSAMRKGVQATHASGHHQADAQPNRSVLETSEVCPGHLERGLTEV